jgi:hypothetical protein
VCVNGGAECLTPSALAERKAQEKQLQTIKAAQKKEDDDATTWVQQQQTKQAKAAQTAAAKKMQSDIAQHIRDINRKDQEIAQQKIITELTYKAQVISISQQELAVAASQSAFLLVPVVGEYTGAVTVGGKITLTYVASKQVVNTLMQSGFDSFLQSKGFIPSDPQQNVVVRLVSPALPYPFQVIIKHEDLVLQRSNP